MPLIPRRRLREAFEDTLQHISALSENYKRKILALWEQLPDARGTLPIMTSLQFLNMLKALYALATEQTSSSIDMHQEILTAMRKTGHALQTPIVVADSNWMRNDFGFVVNPGNGRVEFWRLDPYGQEGAPMLAWTPWLNGTRKDLTWGMYTRPYEYLK